MANKNSTTSSKSKMTDKEANKTTAKEAMKAAGNTTAKEATKAIENTTAKEAMKATTKATGKSTAKSTDNTTAKEITKVTHKETSKALDKTIGKVTQKSANRGLGKGLGKGLGIGALIPGSNESDDIKTDEENREVREVVKEVIKEVVKEVPAETKIKLSLIEPNRDQPRKVFDEDALIELSESIKQYGVLQPLLVQKKDDYYEIIAGERRWRAAKLAGVKEVPVIIKDYSSQEVMEIALIENIQREDLNPIEEAQAYHRLIKDYRLKQDEVAEKVSKSRTAITNSLRLLKLDKRVQDMVMEGKLSNGHARAIIMIEDRDQQYAIAQKIFDEQLSVRDVEKLMRNLNKPEKEVTKPQNDFIYRDLEQKIKNLMGTQVTIKNKNNNTGKIEIEYYSQAELERIYDLLRRSAK